MRKRRTNWTEQKIALLVQLYPIETTPHTAQVLDMSERSVKMKNYRNYESIKINAGDKFAHVSVGNLQHFEGKQFVKEATEANSCEISFGSLPSGESVPFFHTHENNEENYIILSGSGKFQVNDSVFDISEGSVVRVSTHCDRCLKCTSDAPMLYLCIQAKENSLGGYTLDDAAITERVSLL